MASITPEVQRHVEKMTWAGEDLKQDVYIAWLESEVPDGLETDEHLGAYIWGIFHNLKRRERDKQARRAAILLANAGALDDVWGSPSPHEAFEAREKIEARLEALSDVVYQNMEDYYINGMTVPEISHRDGVEPKAIYERLRIGRKILQGDA